MVNIKVRSRFGQCFYEILLSPYCHANFLHNFFYTWNKSSVIYFLFCLACEKEGDLLLPCKINYVSMQIMFTGVLSKSTCKIIMLTWNMIMSKCKIIMLRYDLNNVGRLLKLHDYTDKSHVDWLDSASRRISNISAILTAAQHDYVACTYNYVACWINYLACRGQNYATIRIQ